MTSKSPAESMDSKARPLSVAATEGQSDATENSSLIASKSGVDVVDNLGEALAGVSLMPQTNTNLGTTFLVDSSLAGGQAPTPQGNGGWGNFSEHQGNGNVFTPTSTSIASASPVENVEQDSIRRFLSQDPSQSLGDDFMRSNQPNVSTLGYEEAKTEATAFRYARQPLGLGSGNKNGYGELRQSHESRRHSDSPSGTGTTASSRSVSPYTNADVGNGGRTIPAYQPYEAENGGNYGNPQGFGKDDQSNQGFVPGAQGQSTGLNGMPRTPYSKPGSYGATLPYDHPAEVPFVQADAGQPQVLYMAVPTPDGRGQVLQPVQMLQVPGKPFTYVLPNGAGQGNGGFFPHDSAQPPMMMNPFVASGDNSGHIDAQRGLGNEPPGPYGGMPKVNSAGQFHQGDTGVSGQFAAAPQRPPLDALLGQVRRLSRDQVGCRLVQQALDEEGPMAATLILNEGLPFWGEAMVDPFGNYLFQKILEKITAEERVMLVKTVSTRLVNASLNLHGTRSVQKIVELCAQDEQAEAPGKDDEESAATILTNALSPAAARLCIDSHGNHVIQRILLKLGAKHSRFVFDAVAASVGDVARHRHGCCVIQRCLDSPPNEARSHLVVRIVEKALELMQDAYGNYVVQYVLDVCSDEDVHAVCESVVGKVNLLAIQKFSSNVMEKCLERCSDREKELYLNEMSDPDRIRELMMDPFGNYVVQRALSVATHDQAIRLVEAMRPHLIATQTGNGQRNGGVRNTAGGRRIITKICRRFPNFTLNPVGSQDELYSQNKGSRQSGHHHHHHHGHHIPHHQQPAPVIQPYAAVGGPVAPNHHFNDPRLAPSHLQPPQTQQPPYFDIGNAGGYYNPFSNGQGTY